MIFRWKRPSLIAWSAALASRTKASVMSSRRLRLLPMRPVGVPGSAPKTRTSRLPRAASSQTSEDSLAHPEAVALELRAFVRPEGERGFFVRDLA